MSIAGAVVLLAGIVALVVVLSPPKQQSCIEWQEDAGYAADSVETMLVCQRHEDSGEEQLTEEEYRAKVDDLSDDLDELTDLFNG